MICKHCGKQISDDDYAIHLEGDHKGKMRCCPGDSGMIYGYNAEPEGTECQYPCLGAENV